MVIILPEFTETGNYKLNLRESCQHQVPISLFFCARYSSCVMAPF